MLCDWDVWSRVVLSVGAWMVWSVCDLLDVSLTTSLVIVLPPHTCSFLILGVISFPLSSLTFLLFLFSFIISISICLLYVVVALFNFIMKSNESVSEEIYGSVNVLLSFVLFFHFL